MGKFDQIPINEITFEPASRFDDVGRLFHWNGRVYRAIRPGSADFYRDLFNNRIIQSLFDNGLVRSRIVPLALDGYDLVLQHDRIPFISYSLEWGSEMLRDAALLICDLNSQIFTEGLVLKDVRSWNILFDPNRPVFVDWGAISPIRELKEWPYMLFRHKFIWPLYLMSAGVFRIARISMLDDLNSLRLGDIFRLLLKRVPWTTLVRYWLTDWKCKQDRFRLDNNFFQSLRRSIESIPLKEERTTWTGYDQSYRSLSFHPSDDWPPKVRNVYKLLKSICPETVTDIGCNRGWFSELAALQGARVIAIDMDEPSINSLYSRSRAKELSILPLVMDICAPTPDHGPLHVCSAAQKRMQGELVLALAITHHMVFKRAWKFDVIAAQLSAFTRQWLIVEYIPPDDYWVSKLMSERFAWYNLDNFINALRVFFKRIEVFESSPSPRLLLFCER